MMTAVGTVVMCDAFADNAVAPFFQPVVSKVREGIPPTTHFVGVQGIFRQ